MKHRRIRAGAAAFLLLFLPACREEKPQPEPGDYPDLDLSRVVSSQNITEMTYSEEGGSVIRVIAHSASAASLYFDEGTKDVRTFAVPLTVLDELREVIDRYDMQSWRLREEYGTAEGPVRSFSMREADRWITASSEQMPEYGGDAFLRIGKILRSYALDEYERFPKKVTLAGKEFRTVNGLSNVIDLRGGCWWKLERYPGHYELADAEGSSEDGSSESGSPDTSVTLDIAEDGTFHLSVNGETYDGTLDENRLDGCLASADGGWMWFGYPQGDDLNRLHIEVAPLPYPETFEGFDFVLERRPAIRGGLSDLFGFFGFLGFFG